MSLSLIIAAIAATSQTAAYDYTASTTEEHPPLIHSMRRRQPLEGDEAESPYAHLSRPFGPNAFVAFSASRTRTYSFPRQLAL